MKTTKFLIIVIVTIFFSGIALSQPLRYNAAESLFDDGHIKLLKNAEKFIGIAEKNIDKAAKIETEYEKFKAKEKKYNKKTWEAKKLRIQAEKNHLKAYQDASEAYSDIIVKTTYYDESDKREANSLNEDAADLIKKAEKKMSTYNKELMNSKGLKKMSFSRLNSAIRAARDLKESAYEKQKKALDIVLDQDRKRKLDEADEIAWQEALDINTIPGYEAYIENFSNGKYVEEARRRIRDLRALEVKDTPVVTDYIFKVQIAASKTQLSNYELALRYKKTSEIERVYTNRNYKYRVGKFTNYADAANFRDGFKSSCPDSFIVVFDKGGIQVEVTDSMKGNY